MTVIKLQSSSGDLVGKSRVDADFQTVADNFAGLCDTPDNDVSGGGQQLSRAVIKCQRELVASFCAGR